MKESKVRRAIEAEGYVILPDVFSVEYCSRIKTELEMAIQKEVGYHGTIKHKDYGMVLLCALYGGVFLELLDSQKLMGAFEEVLGPGCIIYAYTSSSMPPMSTNYSNRIHVDCPRVIPNYITNVGATILLDDFTIDNGATWFLPRSQTLQQEPPQEEFFSNALRVIAPAGSVFLFNARLWHAGGGNNSSKWRHALTMNMCRPWMKQRIDIPRAMVDFDLSTVSPTALQKLGFKSQVPASYDEYYASSDKRTFTQAAE